MRELSNREKWMLGLCVAVIFFVVTGFGARAAMRVLRGSDAKIKELESTLADQEMWAEEAPRAEARDQWIEKNLPNTGGATIGKLQGDMIQTMQDEVFNRKLRINQQSLQDVVKGTFYTEVAVRLEIAGAETAVLDWLTTLQAPSKFQVIKELELKLDTRSREIEPQAICSITIARWFKPESQVPTADPGDQPTNPTVETDMEPAGASLDRPSPASSTPNP